MARHRNTTSGVVVSVDDSKDDRFANGWEVADGAGTEDKPPADKPAKAAAKKTADKSAGTS